MSDFYLGKTYSAFIFDINEKNRDVSRTFETLSSIKGKMSAISPDDAHGLRGHLLRAYLAKASTKYIEPQTSPDAWLKTGNFIHTPDNELQTYMLYNHFITLPRD